MSVLPSAASPSRIGGTRVPSYVFETPGDLARHVAQSIAALIRERNAQGQSAVIALPAGSTPTGIYRELVRLHRDEQLDFSRVIVFALDELHGLGLDQPQSHGAILRQQLLRHVNIPAENVFLIDGLTPVEQVAEYAQQVEAAIARAGGLDLALLGIGRNGHVGYNEPYTSRGSRTRIASLDPSTRKAAASDFFGEEHVPTQAITLGLGTLLAAAAARKDGVDALLERLLGGEVDGKVRDVRRRAVGSAVDRGVQPGREGLQAGEVECHYAASGVVRASSTVRATSSALAGGALATR